MKHFIAVHTFTDDERKAEFFAMAPHMTIDDALIKSESANAMQSWISKDEDFFFCHWEAEDEDVILSILDERGMGKFLQTICYELPGFISRYANELDLAEVAKKIDL